MVENGHFIEFFCPPLRTFKSFKSQQKRKKHAKILQSFRPFDFQSIKIKKSFIFPSSNLHPSFQSFTPPPCHPEQREGSENIHYPISDLFIYPFIFKRISQKQLTQNQITSVIQQNYDSIQRIISVVLQNHTDDLLLDKLTNVFITGQKG